MKFRHLSNCNQIIEAVCRINIRTLNRCELQWKIMKNGDAVGIQFIPRPFQPKHFQTEAVEISEISINRFSTTFSWQLLEK